MDKIEITKNSLCYPEIDSFVIIMAALCLSLEYKIKGKAEYSVGKYMTCDGLAIKKGIRLPLHGPIEFILEDKKVEYMEFILDDIAPTPMQGSFRTNALIKTCEYLIAPYFISFYERNYALAESKFKKDYSIWPNAWRMGWVVRNALAHNGKIYFKDLKMSPVTWSGLTISPLDQDKTLFGTFVNFVDILFLLFDMEKELV